MFSKKTKVVILAGGLGTRFIEETETKPKPMVEIGGKPILWHILKMYSHFGFNDFIICLGYKGIIIKQFFYNYFLNNSDITVDLKDNSFSVHHKCEESWKVTLIDTGLNTMTGGRIKKIREYIDDTFMLTYGDGLANVEINQLLEFHKKSGKIATMTTVFMRGQFGFVTIDSNNSITSFREKETSDGTWINAGFFVCEPRIFDFIEGSETVFEKEPLNHLVRLNELAAYKHSGFWKCMDSQKDWQEFQTLWEQRPIWKIWK